MRGWMMTTASGAALALCLGTGAQAGIVFSDDFESTVNTSNWQVYQQISNGQWESTQGTGIEVQTSGTVVDAHSGNQYIELDSSAHRGGTGDAALTNSAMTRTLTGLSAGDYQLEYYYQPRTGTVDDNTIGVYFDSGPLFSTLVDQANGVGANGWLKRTTTFLVGEDDATRQLSFRGEGIQNRLGGFIDTVSLRYLGDSGSSSSSGSGRVPEAPALGFIGLALAFAARRRRRNRK